MTDYSELYIKQTEDLQNFFEKRIRHFKILTITTKQYNDGIDSLPKKYRALNKSACEMWQRQRNYELSYNQACKAMFAALEKLNLLKVTNP